MSSVHRRRIRTVLTGVETSKETLSINSDPLTFELTTVQEFYVGYHEHFGSRYFSLATVNSNATDVTVEYFSKSAGDFAPVLDLLDQTNGFTNGGFISWVNESDWETTTITPIDDEKLFWIKITVSADLSSGTEIESILNLFSDDELLRGYYPELLTDSRWLPTGRTDYVEQHQAAKNLVVQRLLQKGLIRSEGQIIDPNSVAIAAIHATAMIILRPIASSDFHTALLDRAQDAFENEISRVDIGIDRNNDGIVSDSERRVTSGNLIRV